MVKIIHTAHTTALSVLALAFLLVRPQSLAYWSHRRTAFGGSAGAVGGGIDWP